MLVLADWVQVGAGQFPAGGQHRLLKRAEGAFHPSQPEPPSWVRGGAQAPSARFDAHKQNNHAFYLASFNLDVLGVYETKSDEKTHGKNQSWHPASGMVNLSHNYHLILKIVYG